MDRLKAEMGGQSEIDYLVDFVSQSKRGLTR
jgi:UDP-N-acetylglucosamine acyltransferase